MSMLETLRKSWSYYRNNFLQLIISFCVTAVPLQLLIIFSPNTTGWQLFLAYLFIVAFLTSASVNISIVRKLEIDEKIEYRAVLRKLGAKVSQVLGLSVILYFLLVIVLYLLAFFLNFLFSLILLLIPIFTAYVLPEILLEDESLIQSLRKGISLSWNNLLSTASLSLLPGALIVYLWFNGWWILVWCFGIPFLVIGFTVKFLSLL
ncbi:hypothetical protein KGY71_01625 [Candidatus Bipolaricaulota bacterium]|nr:hypothetical protein [Candidatus Bipolaricaulota bacterium]